MSVLTDIAVGLALLATVAVLVVAAAAFVVGVGRELLK